jgi:hypothetical protein
MAASAVAPAPADSAVRALDPKVCAAAAARAFRRRAPPRCQHACAAAQRARVTGSMQSAQHGACAPASLARLRRASTHAPPTPPPRRPQPLFNFFADLSRLPRPSKHEQRCATLLRRGHVTRGRSSLGSPAGGAVRMRRRPPPRRPRAAQRARVAAGICLGAPTARRLGRARQHRHLQARPGGRRGGAARHPAGGGPGWGAVVAGPQRRAMAAAPLIRPRLC